MTTWFLAINDLPFIWKTATVEGRLIIIALGIFSTFAWSVMAAKAMQIRRANRLNQLFDVEFRAQKHILEVYDRRVTADGCPLFTVYKEGCEQLDARLRSQANEGRKSRISLKSIEHVKRALESAVAREALKLEAGLIVLSLAVSGGPFLGLLGTVWGVMSSFSDVATAVAAGGRADLATMAPGVAAAMATTVAGLLVAIPSMFGYNWLVHSVRVGTVELDNFAQELVSKMETEYLKDDEE